MVMTLTWKPWILPFEGEAGRPSNTPTPASNPSCAKPHLYLPAIPNYALNDAESGTSSSSWFKHHPTGRRKTTHPFVAKYAINLAQSFNKYYAHTRILEDPERDNRLALAYVQPASSSRSLRLLGVDAPWKM